MSEVEKHRQPKDTVESFEFQPKDTVESFEFQPKDTVLTMRLSGLLLDKIKEQAKEKNIDYQKYIRMILEQNINKGE